MPYIGKSPEFGVRNRFVYQATSGQTSFSGSDSDSLVLTYSDSMYMDVYQNGVLLKPVTDYASTTGTSVVLVTGASTDDVVEMIVYDSFAVADTVSAANGGTFSDNVAMGGNLSVTGDLTVDTSTLKVDSTNNKVGVGTASPARQITVENTIANAGGEVGILSSDSSTSGTFGTIHFGNNTDTSLASIRAKADGSTTAGKLEFSTEVDGGSIETRMTIDSNGVLSSTSASANIANFTTANATTSNIAFKYNTSTALGYFGSGSGLLSAASATDFVMRSENDIVFATGGNNERVRLGNNGNVSIGNNSTPHKLMVYDYADRGDSTAPFAIYGYGYQAYHFLDSNAYYIGQNSNSRAFRIYSGTSGGVSLAAGGTSWGTYSDERLKTDIEPIENGVDKLANLRCVSYRLSSNQTDDDGNPTQKKLGLIAQDLEGVLDEVIDSSKIDAEDETDYLSVRYTEVIPVLVKAIQEQKATITAQQSTITAFEARITALEAG